jgi:hypothetical protein
MEVEVVRFDKMNIGSMETIIVKKFDDTEEAHNYYTNWQYDECNSDNVLVLGKDWNKTDKTEIKIPDNYKYTYTYSVNLWDLEYDDIAHSHNFLIYTKQK